PTDRPVPRGCARRTQGPWAPISKLLERGAAHEGGEGRSEEASITWHFMALKIKWARRTRDGSLSRKATCLPLLLSPGSRGSLSRIARPPRAMCSDVGQVRQCAPQCGDVQRCGLGEASETA
ncbi:unnamed protein product, partial [Prorocentrum cordatum]